MRPRRWRSKGFATGEPALELAMVLECARRLLALEQGSHEHLEAGQQLGRGGLAFGAAEA